MQEKLNRRAVLKAAISALLFPAAAEGAENNAEAVSATAKSLAEGIRKIHGHAIDPRDSGYMHHPNVLKHYAKGMQFGPNLSDREIGAAVHKKLLNRIKIYSVTPQESDLLRQECETGLREQATAMQSGEVGAFLYISADRAFQRLYAVKKSDSNSLEFLESYPMSTSRAEPRVPLLRDVHPSVNRESPFTPLGLFKIPLDGVRPALLGEVTKVERPDLTRYYFEPLSINGKMRYFVRDFGKSTDDEIITVTGDTHLLWSPEINGRGIKIHDTTEVDDIGKPVSSGCIRTPSVRRFTVLTSDNKYPTQVFIYWAKAKNTADRDTGFGGIFGGERVK